MVEVVMKSNLARELRQIALAALTHELLEGKVNEFAFGAYAGERKGLLDELIVHHDVGTHSISLKILMVYSYVYYKRFAPRNFPTELAFIHR